MSIQELSFDEVNEVSGGIICSLIIGGAIVGGAALLGVGAVGVGAAAVGVAAVGAVGVGVVVGGTAAAAVAGAATVVGVGSAVRFTRVRRGTNCIPAVVYINGCPVF